MQISAMKTNHLTTPLGFDLTTITFSWKTDEPPETTRLQVSKDAAFKEIIHDSGLCKEISSAAYHPKDLPLKPRTRYHWQITTHTSKGETTEQSWFETGKMKEPWTAKWIVSPLEKDIHPLIRHSFQLEGEVESARIYACGLGVYNLQINGQSLCDEYLAPGYHGYNHWLQVQTYDLAPSLFSKSENVIGAMLGNGWAKGRFGLGDKSENYCGEFGLIAELYVKYKNADNYVLAAATGNAGEWLCAPSPVTYSSIYNGETYDANMEQPGWSSPGFTITGWEKAITKEDYQQAWGLGPLTDRLSPPVKIMHEIKPVELIQTPAGEKVLDMGQNMVGLLEFTSRAPKGQKLSLYFGEILQNDNFYRDNLRSALAEYHYISDGSQRQVSQLFTFYGFRYVKLVGFENINLADFTGQVLYSDMEPTGKIETSNQKVNRLFQNVIWGQRGNFLDVPTDCPQRDERLGWTGDAQVFCETAAWNKDVLAFFAKYMRDMAYVQDENNGMVTHVVPDAYNRETGKGMGGGACGWADAAAVIPWTLYEMYGDKQFLQNSFHNMRAWTDWIKTQDEANGGRRLYTTGFHFGDWLALDAPIPNGTFGATDVGFIASAYYYRCAEFTAKAAQVIGENNLAKEYEALAAQVKAAMLGEYFSPKGRIAVRTQSAMVIALDFGIYPEGCKKRLAEDLKFQLVKDGMKLKTGFLGTPALCRVLSDNDAHGYALRLFFNEEYPGWLYPVNMGATTIWERWNSVNPDGMISDTGMNSLNHYAYGCVASWMYRYLCGITPIEAGFSKVRIAPKLTARLDYVIGSFDSPYGMVESKWQRNEDGQLTMDTTIPQGTVGEWILPRADLKEVQKSFPNAMEAAGEVKVSLTPGQHKITYTPIPPRKFTLETPMYDFFADEEASKLLCATPSFAQLPENIMAYTLREFKHFITNFFLHLGNVDDLVEKLTQMEIYE